MNLCVRIVVQLLKACVSRKEILKVSAALVVVLKTWASSFLPLAAGWALVSVAAQVLAGVSEVVPAAVVQVLVSAELKPLLLVE